MVLACAKPFHLRDKAIRIAVLAGGACMARYKNVPICKDEIDAGGCNNDVNRLTLRTPIFSPWPPAQYNHS